MTPTDMSKPPLIDRYSMAPGGFLPVFPVEMPTTPNIARLFDVERRLVAAEEAVPLDEALVSALCDELGEACAALTDEERNS